MLEMQYNFTVFHYIFIVTLNKEILIYIARPEASRKIEHKKDGHIGRPPDQSNGFLR